MVMVPPDELGTHPQLQLPGTFQAPLLDEVIWEKTGNVPTINKANIDILILHIYSGNKNRKVMAISHSLFAGKAHRKRPVLSPINAG
jgi:hypothetical protein